LADNLAESIKLKYTDAALTPVTNTTTIVVVPAAASKLAVKTEPSASATAGVAFTTQPAVYVEDQFGNVVTNDSSTVTAALATGTGPLQGTATISASAGVATFSGLADNLAESIKLKYTDAALTPVTNTTTIVVSPAAASKLVVKTEPSATATAGVAFTTQPAVYVEDQYGNIATNNSSTVTAALVTGTGPLQGTAAISASAGVATFSGLADNLAESIKLKYTDAALTPVTNTTTIVVSPAAASKLVITSAAVTTTAGVASGTITVQRQDSFGNPNTADANRTVTLASTSTGTVTFSPASPLTITSGSSTATFTYTDTQAGTPTITAASTSPNTITSATQVETVNAAAASKLSITNAVVTVTAGVVSGTITVQSQDAFGNAQTNATVVTVNLTSSSTGATFYSTNGVTVITSTNILANQTTASYFYKDTVAGSPTITNAASGLTSDTQVVTVVPAGAFTLTMAQQPSGTATAGTAFATQPQVTVVDQFGNNVANGTTVTATETSGGNLNGTATAPTATTTGGVATFSGLFVTNTSGSVTLTFTANGHTVNSSSINVSPGAIASYAVGAGTATRAAAFNVTVTAKDAYGNPVTTDNSTVVTLSSGSANVQFTGNPATLTAGTFTISALDNYFETVTLTATDANAKTGSASVNINPANGDFISRATGNWNASGTWSNWTGSAWANAGSAPTSSTSGTNEICVQSPHTVTVTASVTASNFVLNAGGTLSISSSQTFSVGNGLDNGVISGAGILKESGAGNLLDLNGNNTFTGGIVISAGTVSVTNVNSTGVQQLGTGGITFDTGGILLNSGTGGQSTAKAITLNTGGGVISMVGPTMSLTGTIGGGGGLTTGGSDLILSPSAATTIGTLTANSGRLFIFSANAIANSAVLHINNSAILDFNITGGFTPANTITFASGAAVANRVGTLTLNTTTTTFPTSGTMIFNEDDQVSTAITVTGAYPALTGPLIFQTGGYNASVGTVTLSGAISGSFGITKTSTGTLVLGTANTYTGGTTVSGGFLTANVTGSLGGGTLSIVSGATNTLANGTTESVAGLYLNGVRQVAGTWGSTASTAANKSNYFGSTATGILTAGGITVTAQANTKLYDGTTNAATAPTITTGELSTGDTATLAETYTSKSQGSGKTLVPTAVILDAGSNNVTAYYTITYANNTAGVINKTNLTVTAATNAKLYDGTTSAAGIPTITAGSIQTGDTAPTWTETYDTKNVGTGKTLTPAGLVNDGNSGLNYNYTYATVTTGLITTTNLTLTAVANTKNYNGSANAAAAPSVTAGSLQPGDTAGFTESYGDKNVGVGKTLTPAGVANDGNSGLNYSYTFIPASTGVINTTNLSVTAATNTKTYDGTTNAAATPTVTAGSIQSGDTANFTESYSTIYQGTGKTLTPAGTVTDGNGGNNYNYNFVGITTGVINPKGVTITNVVASSKTYDGTTNASLSGGAVAGGVNGDAVTFTPGTGTFASKNVGTWAVTATGYALTTSGISTNYSLSAQPLVPNANITALSVTITNVVASNKTYDGTTSATLSGGAVSNTVGGDTVTFTPGTGTFGSQYKGTWAVTASGYALSTSGVSTNYSLSAQPSVPNATITGRSVVITNVIASNKGYDGTTSATLSGGVVSNTVSGDTVTFTAGTGAFASQYKGTWAVTASGYALSTSGIATNYSLSVQPLVPNASITALGVTITNVVASNKSYDGTTNATLSGGAVSNTVSGDTVTFTAGSGGFASKFVGTWAVAAGGYSLSTTGVSTNYSLLAQPLVPNASIIGRSVVITNVTAASKPYDGTTSATLSGGVVSNTVSGDTVTFTAGTGAFASQYKGTWTVTASGYALAMSGIATNYSLSAQPLVSNASITALGVTITNVVASNKTYDGTTNATLSGGAVAGTVAGDPVTFTAGSGGFASKNVGSWTVTASGYALTASGISTNYSLSAQPLVPNASITAAGLGITAGNDTKTYGQARTYGAGQTNFTATGLQAGETIGTVTITASGGTATNAAVGTYNLTPSAPTGGTFTAGNYSIAYTNGTLTVNAAVLGITAASTNRTYGAANPTFTYTASGFVNGETTTVLSGSPSLTTTATTNSAVNSYTITAAVGGLSAANYTFSFTNGTLTVNPLAVVLTGSRAYDGTTNAAFGILSVANVVNGDNVLVASGTGGLADKSAGTQGLTSFGDLALGNNPAGNYTLAGASGSVTITQAVTAITVLSSLNPVGYKGSVYFTATNLPADATGYVLFLANSAAFSSNSLSSGGTVSLTITNLPRGTNVITAQYAGDDNYLGSTNLLAGGQVVTNHPPVAGNVTFTRSVNAIKISLGTLFTNVTDVDGDVISLAGVSTSTNGITVTTNSTLMVYVNTNNVNDQFNYTVSDGFGGTATGTIVINYYPFPVVGQNASVTISGGAAALSFLGIPNFRYGIERSTNMTDWAVILITNAPANGAFHYIDNFSDLGTNVPASAFYRLEWNP